MERFPANTRKTKGPLFHTIYYHMLLGIPHTIVDSTRYVTVFMKNVDQNCTSVTIVGLMVNSPQQKF